jgi:hypothetical protein
MGELTPEQQAELAVVRAVADSLRRRMPDLDDYTLGRVAFNLADLLNGVAVVLTSTVDMSGRAARNGTGDGDRARTEGWLAEPDSFGPADSPRPPAPTGGPGPAPEQPPGQQPPEAPMGPWRADFYQDGRQLEQAQWPDREQALRAVAGRVRWLAFDGTDVTVRLVGPGGIELGHEAVLAAIEELRRG